MDFSQPGHGMGFSRGNGEFSYYRKRSDKICNLESIHSTAERVQPVQSTLPAFPCFLLTMTPGVDPISFK